MRMGVLKPEELDLLSEVFEATGLSGATASEREGRATKIIAYYHTGITDKQRLIGVIKRM
jgi:hypothetical protein